MNLTELQLNRNLYKTEPQTSETLGAGDVASNLSPTPSSAIASGNSVTDINTNAEQLNGEVIAPGSIPVTTFDISDLGWIQTCVFSVTDADTVAWTSGVFTSAKGVSYSISAGNTGNMTAQNYIYLNINASLTAYQVTTTQSNIIGPGKVLIAVAQNGSVNASYALTQTIQVVANNIVANTLSAISANMGLLTAGQIIVVSGGNTVALDPSGTNVIYSGPTGAPNFYVSPTGYASAIGFSSLNMKTYTCFETSTRFTPTLAGNGVNIYATSGLTQETSATVTSSAAITWRVSQEVFGGSPTFSVALYMANLNSGSGGGGGFYGLGNPTITGAGITFTSLSFCGFYFQKSGSTITVYAVQNSSTLSYSSTTLTTVVTGDSFDGIIKMNGSTSVDYYYRKNGGAVSTKTTISTLVPTSFATGVTTFGVTNVGSAVDFQITVLSSSYER